MAKRISQSRRDSPPTPNYLSGAFQRQMLLLLAALVLVLILMKIAARPSSWAWMWGSSGAGSSPPTRSDSRVPPAPWGEPREVDPGPPAGVESAAGGNVTGIPAELQAALRESVKDDTFFRSSEREVWFQLFAWLRETDPSQLPAPMDVSSLQLLQQMPAYRGRLVRTRGVVRQATSIAIPEENQAGISSYWQCWLQDAAGTAPIVVYALQLPDGFPEGADLQESAEFTGVAFKRWAYQAQDGLLVAPVLLARTADWTPPAAVPERRSPTADWLWISILGVVILSLLVVRWIFAGFRRTPRSLSLVALAIILTSSGASAQTANAPPDLAEILQLHKLDASQWRRFVDGVPLGDEEREPLYRVLFVLPRLETAELSRLRQASPLPVADLSRQPDEMRGQLYRIDGHVLAAREVSLPPESARRFGYTRYYEVFLESSEDPHPRVVYAREIPTAWRNAVSIRDSRWLASCFGLFLKRGVGDSGSEPLLFAADRIAWHPHQPDPSAGVNEGMALLGSVGVDVGRLDDVAQKQPLVAEDREAFYQMLWATERLKPQEPVEPRASAIAVEDLLQRPEEFAGQLLTIAGTARRALRVEVSDPEIRERFGLDHYFEVELFRLLPQPLKLIDSRDGQAHVYRSFPMTVCLTRLPPEMPQGADIQQEVKVTGWFLKLWSYRSRFLEMNAESAASGSSPEKRQISPLLVGISLETVVPPPASDSGVGWFVAIGFVAALGGIAVAARWYRRDDQAFARWRKSRAEGENQAGRQFPR